MADAVLRFIAHPEAGHRAFAQRWPAVAAELALRRLEHQVELTTRRLEAAELSCRAAEAGARLIVAVGGDGTLHEVVNGLLSMGRATAELPAVGLVPTGRGSDYARTLDLSADPVRLVARFAAALGGDPGALHPVDAGEVTYAASARVAGRPAPSRGADGSRLTRWFINGAGVGFSPFVAQRTSRFPARLGQYLYTAAGLATIIDWRERAVRLRWADGAEETRAVESVEVALGRFEGGGMLVAPGADPSDGLFDVVIVDALSRAEMTTFAWRIRSGDHLRSPRVGVRRTPGLELHVADGRGPLYLQADGELLGCDPFAFRILPAALQFVW